MLENPVADDRREPGSGLNLALASLTNDVSDDGLRGLVIDTLKNDPSASLDQINTRLRVRTGRVISSGEAQRLQTIYQMEGFAARASDSRSGEAARVARLATFVHYRPNTHELVGLAAGLIPLLVHLPSITLPRSNAPGATGSYFDFIALVGGVAAIVAGYGGVSLARRGAQLPVHIAVISAIFLLGVYQVLLGLGILHRIGVYHFG